MYVRHPERIKEHKYASHDASVLAFIVEVWWEAIVKLYPLWLAPNVVTLLGFLATILAVVCVELWSQFPAAGVLIFMYQMFDSTDGKQARRTGNSSPVGEIWDHCVDSICTGLIAMMLSSYLHFFDEPSAIVAGMAFVVLASGIGFFASHWEEYHTGTLYFPPISAPTEGLMGIAVCFLLVTVTGTEFWNYRHANWVLLFPALMIGGLATIYGNIKNGLNAVWAGKTGNYTSPSRTASEALLILVPMLVSNVCALVATALDPRFVFTHRILCCLTIFFICSYLSVRPLLPLRCALPSCAT